MSTHEPTRDGDGPAPDEDAAALVERVRNAPAHVLITEVFSTLLSTAQIKVGRRDARLFIDLCALALDHARRHLPGELTAQVEGALGQLRFAQVSAEGAADGRPEANDLDPAPTPPGERAQAEPGSRQPGPDPEAEASGLWVPGS
jgi:hypothetical protein